MKRLFVWLLVCAFLVCFFGVNNALAVESRTCDDSQTLFRMSGKTDAHGAIWNDADPDYSNWEICFNNYFTARYQANSIVHDCISGGSNRILNLAGTTNAHAELPSVASADYPTRICYGYGDFSCINTTKECNDTSVGGGTNFAQIVSLANFTNAHISLTNIYPQRICCNATGYTPICNYNGVCDRGNGEDDYNCPDCKSVCGDGQVTGLEECDGTNLNGFACNNFTAGSIYYGGNLGCSSCMFDASSCRPANCSDGIDNDNDDGCDYNGCRIGGRLLPPDFACSGPNDDSESDVNASCQDGIDNDGDRQIDFNFDSGCSSKQDHSEATCGNGVLEQGITENEVCEYGADNLPGTEDDDVDGKTCHGVNSAYSGGNLTCATGCRAFDLTLCEGYPGFCQANEPFLIDDPSGATLSPSSCQDYNDVYPGNGVNVTQRKNLCLSDCVPGASDPANNGYAGAQLADWGCGWDSVNQQCYFYFNSSSNPNDQCRLNYTVTQQCSENNPFRLVHVTASPTITGASYTCDACGSGASSCDTQIICPRVIQLPFIGFFGIIATVVLIAGIYFYFRKKK